MTTINLRDFYQWYIQDEIIEVSDEVAAELRADKLYETAHKRRLVRNKAQYSLDCGDRFEYAAGLRELLPKEVPDKKERFFRQWNALNSLLETQGRHVDAYLILGKTCRENAETEEVSIQVVCAFVKRGLKSMRE